jgi:hypothetical protein
MKSMMLMISLMGGVEEVDNGQDVHYNMQNVGVSYKGATLVRSSFDYDGNRSHVSVVGNKDMKMMNLNYPFLYDKINLHLDAMQMEDMLDSLSVGVGFIINDKLELKFNVGGRKFEMFENENYGKIDSEFANMQLLVKF